MFESLRFVILRKTDCVLPKVFWEKYNMHNGLKQTFPRPEPKGREYTIFRGFQLSPGGIDCECQWPFQGQFCEEQGEHTVASFYKL